MILLGGFIFSSYSQNKKINFVDEVSQIDSLLSTSMNAKEKQRLDNLKPQFENAKMGIGYLLILDSTTTDQDQFLGH